MLTQLDLTPHPNGQTPLPEDIFELLRDVLHASYPPDPEDKIVAFWLLRSLLTVIDDCPSEFLERILYILNGPLCNWIADLAHEFSTEEYSNNVSGRPHCHAVWIYNDTR